MPDGETRHGTEVLLHQVGVDNKPFRFFSFVRYNGLRFLVRAMEKLRAKDELAILLVEQNTRVALDFSERTVVLDRGRVVYDGDSRTLKDDKKLLDSLIGVTG